MAWSVRRATEQDAVACLALLRSASTSDAGPLGRVSWNHPRVAGLVASDAAAGHLYAVTDAAGALVATFAVCDTPDDYFGGVAWAEPDAPARYLHRLAVSPSLHGGGLGSWSLKHAERIAARDGARYLRLDALQKVDRVLRFYARMGYAERGVVWVESDESAQPKIPLACFERALPEVRITVLIIPGLHGSGPRHWQTVWERERDDCLRVEQRDWQNPRCVEWVETLGAAVTATEGPLVLVAHSLGCITVAHWAAQYATIARERIAGALLVAPSDVDRPGFPAVASGFSPAPIAPLLFPTIVVASADDPFISLARAEQFADAWGSRFVAIGAKGHLNSDSGLGAWPDGQALLDTLLLSATGATSSE
jgi:predicted alpha/beta hydrolase family esterase/GNAT superfamily N-acetyltransferase